MGSGIFRGAVFGVRRVTLFVVSRSRKVLFSGQLRIRARIEKGERKSPTAPIRLLSVT
jgi:hypothetical protein